jgi:hypothetical protein
LKSATNSYKRAEITITQTICQTYNCIRIIKGEKTDFGLIENANLAGRFFAAYETGEHGRKYTTDKMILGHVVQSYP